MSTTRATIRTSIFASQAISAPAGGGGTAEVSVDRVLTLGGLTIQNGFQHAIIFQPSIPGGSSELLNLQTQPDVTNVAAVLTGVVVLVVEWPAVADGPLEIKPSAIEPWLALLKDVTDVLQVQPGSRIELHAPKGLDYAVNGVGRVLQFDNLGTVEASPKVTILGSSS